MPREGPYFVVIECVVQYCTNDILVVTNLFSFPLHLYAGPSVLQGGHMDYYYYDPRCFLRSFSNLKKKVVRP